MQFFNNGAINRSYVHAGLQTFAENVGGVFVFVFLLKAGLTVPIVFTVLGNSWADVDGPWIFLAVAFGLGWGGNRVSGYAKHKRSRGLRAILGICTNGSFNRLFLSLHLVGRLAGRDGRSLWI